jgi:hypothetical protein
MNTANIAMNVSFQGDVTLQLARWLQLAQRAITK